QLSQAGKFVIREIESRMAKVGGGKRNGLKQKEHEHHQRSDTRLDSFASQKLKSRHAVQIALGMERVNGNFIWKAISFTPSLDFPITLAPCPKKKSAIPTKKRAPGRTRLPLKLTAGSM